jgi:hypothetical protein
MKLTVYHRKQLNKAVFAILKPTYFESIPLGAIFDVMKDWGFVVVQEDGTPWSGFLCGEEGQANFRFNHGEELVDNSMLVLTWHKMQSGRYEVCGYIS